jgi:rubredoxin
MKQAYNTLFAILLIMVATTAAFSPSANSVTRSTRSTELNLFGFGEKDDGSPGDYVCKDCGYVFTKGPAAWAKLDDSYGCPPCGAPKFRFNKVAKGSASGKVEVKKSWFG